ncbi:hypothetical protein EON63_09555 [archaeon]|nr:MAG: hypothetical protein EON63_09555 [archaeon]
MLISHIIATTYTIYHTPYTINDTPYTIYHIPYTIYHIPYTIQRPVYRSNTTNHRWVRIKSSVRFQKDTPSSETPSQVVFEHGVDCDGDKISFAFTYPYTYTQLMEELDGYDAVHSNNFSEQVRIMYPYRCCTIHIIFP